MLTKLECGVIKRYPICTGGISCSKDGVWCSKDGVPCRKWYLGSKDGISCSKMVLTVSHVVKWYFVVSRVKLVFWV